MIRVFIDPGHGGTDPGATANGLREKDVTLALSTAVAEKLEGLAKCETKLSRTFDKTMTLRERTTAANVWGADYFVSIHTNGHTNRDANGYEDFIHVAPLKDTIDRRSTLHPVAAETWVNEGRQNRGMKRANFFVLRETIMPAVLLENGFITNETDATLMKNPEFIKMLAHSIALGIVVALDLELHVNITGTNILGPARASLSQAQEWARSRLADDRYVDIAPLYWKYGRLTGIRPEVLYAQAAKETAFGRYSGAVIPLMNNWAGIKIKNPTDDKTEDHEDFTSPDDGVRAHFNHMAAYVGLDPVGVPHERYYVVQSLPWAGTVQTAEQLGGKWAPAIDYGESIVRDYLKDLMSTDDTNGNDDLIFELQKEVSRLNSQIADMRSSITSKEEVVKSAIALLKSY